MFIKESELAMTPASLPDGYAGLPYDNDGSPVLITVDNHGSSLTSTWIKGDADGLTSVLEDGSHVRIAGTPILGGEIHPIVFVQNAAGMIGYRKY